MKLTLCDGEKLVRVSKKDGFITFRRFIEQQINRYMREGLSRDDARDKAYDEYHSRIEDKVGTLSKEV